MVWCGLDNHETCGALRSNLPPVRLAILRQRGCPSGCLVPAKPHPVGIIHFGLEPPPGPGVFFGVCVMRRVPIVEKPNETYSYAAVDQQTGDVPLRLSDRH